MTSAVAASHLPESLSGPCGLFRDNELNTQKVTHKVTKLQLKVQQDTVCVVFLCDVITDFFSCAESMFYAQVVKDSRTHHSMIHKPLERKFVNDLRRVASDPAISPSIKR